MEYFRDHKYPNGWTKSRLHEVVLTHHHFGISREEYQENLQFLKIEESNNQKNCEWLRDTDSRLIVPDLQFLDSEFRLAITERGFEFTLKPYPHREVRVFINYAREDFDSAKRMFEDLKGAGFQPWLDRESLLPGQRWAVGIEQAIRSCHYFVALQSSSSVVKRGYVQKEIHTALTKLEEIPELGVFFIPARLDNCPPSHSVVGQLNRVDMFPDWDKGFDEIMKALKTNT